MTTPKTLIPSESGDLSTCLEQLIFYFLGSWKAEHSFGRLWVECALKDENAAFVHFPDAKDLGGGSVQQRHCISASVSAQCLQNGQNCSRLPTEL